MPDEGKYDGMATSLHDVPAEPIQKLAPIIVERFANGTGSLFNEMREALPKTWSALANGYPVPVIALKRVPPVPGVPHATEDLPVELLLRGEQRIHRVEKPTPLDDPVGYRHTHCAQVLDTGVPSGPLFEHF